MNEEIKFWETIDGVIVIDFGTKRTGYGIATKEIEDVVTKWGKFSGYKNKTVLLYKKKFFNGDNKELEPVAWGDEAENKYQKLDEKERNDYYLIDNFKMFLNYNDEKPTLSRPSNRTNLAPGINQPNSPIKNLPMKSPQGNNQSVKNPPKKNSSGNNSPKKNPPTNNTPVKNPPNKPLPRKNDEMPFIEMRGRKIPVVNIIGDFLKLVKKDIIAYLKNKKYIENLKKDRLKCVITVPAIWTDKMKYMMREACQRAGIIKELEYNPKHFEFMLEPEAAAVHVYQSKEGKVWIKERDVFLLLDAGGGTIDISVYEMIGGQLNQLIKSSGGSAGGAYVDLKFVEWLCDHLRGNFASNAYDKNEVLKMDKNYYTFLNNWANIKEEFGEDEQNDPNGFQTIDIPSSMKKKFQQLGHTEDTNNPISLEKDSVKIPNKKMLDFFRDSLEKSKKYCDDILKQIKVQKVFVVGGFGGSHIYKSEIEKFFQQKNIPVYSPNDPGKAIILGALKQHTKPSVNNRIIPVTYGVSVCAPFIQGIHPDEKKLVQNQQVLCKDIFSQVITEGTKVSIGSKIENTFGIAKNGDKLEISFCMYEGTKKPTYVTDTSVSLAKFNLILPPNINNKSVVKTIFHFGESELNASVEIDNKELYRSPLRFDLFQRDQQEEIKESLPFHLILGLDSSGSMDGEKFQHVRECTAEILEQCSTVESNIVSMIIYDHKSEIVVGLEPMSKKQEVLKEIKFMGGGTSFKNAFNNIREVLLLNKNDLYTPVVLFLTDGMSDNGDEEIASIYLNFPEAQVFMIGFQVSEKSKQRLLTLCGEKGQYRDAKDGVELKQRFKEISLLIQKNN
eukprot:TRINITY_DN2359_c0_g1_i1.p1 TRINITY_DN2359_c0_g1~~TRINITY_DN2359_c0_g1_i1.p1  ORF type:complete len:840 (-),score=299.16 TRINITY_DN2359_c0_g1_i1:18-2537(-)